MEAKFVQKWAGVLWFSRPWTIAAMYVPSEINAVVSPSDPEPSISTALSLAVSTTGMPAGIPVASAASGVSAADDVAGHLQLQATCLA